MKYSLKEHLEALKPSTQDAIFKAITSEIKAAVLADDMTKLSAIFKQAENAALETYIAISANAKNRDSNNALFLVMLERALVKFCSNRKSIKQNLNADGFESIWKENRELALIKRRFAPLRKPEKVFAEYSNCVDLERNAHYKYWYNQRDKASCLAMYVYGYELTYENDDFYFPLNKGMLARLADKRPILAAIRAIHLSGKQSDQFLIQDDNTPYLKPFCRMLMLSKLVQYRDWFDFYGLSDKSIKPLSAMVIDDLAEHLNDIAQMDTLENLYTWRSVWSFESPLLSDQKFYKTLKTQYKTRLQKSEHILTLFQSEFLIQRAMLTKLDSLCAELNAYNRPLPQHFYKRIRRFLCDENDSNTNTNYRVSITAAISDLALENIGISVIRYFKEYALPEAPAPFHYKMLAAIFSNCDVSPTLQNWLLEPRRIGSGLKYDEFDNCMGEPEDIVELCLALDEKGIQSMGDNGVIANAITPNDNSLEIYSISRKIEKAQAQKLKDKLDNSHGVQHNKEADVSFLWVNPL